MERWKNVRVFCICLLALPFTNSSGSKEQKNHPECLEDPHGMVALEGANGRKTHVEISDTNTATRCKTRCRNLQYRFAGTQERRCVCGDNIKTGTRLSTCDEGCPGDEEEICGGSESISLYHTGLKVTTTTTRTKATRSDTSKTSADWKVQTEASTTTVLSGNDSTDDNSSTTSTALYISVPALIVAAGVIVFIVCTIVRLRRVKVKQTWVSYCGKTLKREGTDAVNGTDVEGTRLLECSSDKNSLLDSGLYAESSAENRKFGTNGEAEYSAVYLDHGLNMEANKQYDHFQSLSNNSMATGAVYSHIDVTQEVQNSNSGETTYSHLDSVRSKDKSSNSRFKTDNIYNTFQCKQYGNKIQPSSTRTGYPEETVYDTSSPVVGAKHATMEDLNEYAHLDTHINDQRKNTWTLHVTKE